jgi:hypothetical protein
MSMAVEREKGGKGIRRGARVEGRLETPKAQAAGYHAAGNF